MLALARNALQAAAKFTQKMLKQLNLRSVHLVLQGAAAGAGVRQPPALLLVVSVRPSFGRNNMTTLFLFVAV
jgi:hypothetical protein